MPTRAEHLKGRQQSVLSIVAKRGVTRILSPFSIERLQHARSWNGAKGAMQKGVGAPALVMLHLQPAHIVRLLRPRCHLSGDETACLMRLLHYLLSTIPGAHPHSVPRSPRLQFPF